MSRVAFITTMKPPDHPTPSGDRTFARLILAALAKAGIKAEPITTLSTWRKTPDQLPAIESRGEALLAQTLRAWRAEGAPDAVLTYHNYHKGPDLIGPHLADAFDLPYAIVEPSRAPRHAVGPWAAHFAHADRALTRANALGAVTRQDFPALADFAPDRVMDFPPFIDISPFQTKGDAPRGSCHFVTAAMLRPGRKVLSVEVLAAAWPAVAKACPNARLTIAGDGEARAALEPLFPPSTFIGLLSQPELAALYASADIFVWPAIDEPFGFTFLEAQAARLAILAGNSRGVPDVVNEGMSALLLPPNDPSAWASAMIELANARERRDAMAEAAAAFAKTRDLAAGAASVTDLLARAEEHKRRGGA